LAVGGRGGVVREVDDDLLVRPGVIVTGAVVVAAQAGGFGPGRG